MRRTFAVAFGITLGFAVAVYVSAARDSSGTYSLSPSSPFVTGTPISSSTMNARFSDVATALSDSLSRSGSGGMLAPLRCVDGSATLPSLAFNSETGTGFYRIGTNNVGLSIGGTKRWDFAAAGSTLTGTLTVSGSTTLQSTLAVTGATTLGAVTLGGAVTGMDKSDLPSIGQQVSASTGNFSTASATPVDVTNATVTITTTGRPVRLFLQPDGSTTVDASAYSTGAAAVTIRLLRDGTTIARMAVGDSNVPVGAVQFLDVPAAGTYSYKLQANTPGAGTAVITYSMLVAYEL
jgi:hypothetical protein